MARLAGALRVGSALRSTTTNLAPSSGSPRGRRKSPRLAICVAGAGACLLLGCAGEQSGDGGSPPSAKLAIPVPERGLLQPPTDPGCEAKTSRSQAHERDTQGQNPEQTKVANLGGPEQSVRSDGQPRALPSAPQASDRLGQADPNVTLGLRIRLEYERDCFRRAEAKMRERLRQLQAAVGKTIEAVKRKQRDGS
jgi:hypothetical protein